jgi:hypothetical protein
MHGAGRALLRGALGGLIGTVAMSLPILAARRVGLMGEAPPRRIAGRLLSAVGVRRREEETEIAAATLLHLGFGTGAGALFGVLARYVRLPIAVPVRGVGYALGVWFASYQGWIPALSLLPPASRDRPDRRVVLVAAHVVYGAVLGACMARGDGEG